MPGLPPAARAAARAARAKIDALLDSLDPETLAALQSGAIFDDAPEDAALFPAARPVPAEQKPRVSPRPTVRNPQRPAGASATQPAAARATTHRQNEDGASRASIGRDSDGIEASSLRGRAWTLSCRGMRSPAIAEAIGVPERTVRNWLARDRAALEEDLPDLRREQALAAVESLRAALAAAWGAFEDERATEEEFAQATRRAFRVRELTPKDAASAPYPPRRPTNAARYLSLVLRAQADLVRLLGLSHTLLDAPGPTVPLAPSVPQPDAARPPQHVACYQEQAAPVPPSTPAGTGTPAPFEKAAKTANTDIPATSTTTPSLAAPSPTQPPLPPSAGSPRTENAAKTAIPASPFAGHVSASGGPVVDNSPVSATSSTPAVADTEPRDHTPAVGPAPIEREIAARTATAPSLAPIPPMPSPAVPSPTPATGNLPPATPASSVSHALSRSQTVVAHGRAPTAHQRRKAAKSANGPVLVRPRPSP